MILGSIAFHRIFQRSRLDVLQLTLYHGAVSSNCGHIISRLGRHSRINGHLVIAWYSAVADLERTEAERAIGIDHCSCGLTGFTGRLEQDAAARERFSICEFDGSRNRIG